VLSPMVDVTDAAFRSIAATWGADITCAEMVSAAALVHGNEGAWRLVAPWPGEQPYGVQIMGGDAAEMAAAVDLVATRIQPDYIDLNLGCPSPHILASCAGGFLLKDPKHAGRVIAAAVDAGAAHGVPVTAKLRLGMDDEHRTYLAVGEEAQAAGAAWVTLHGRTVAQGYSGLADWNAIGRLVEHLDIPVVGNGDLRTPDDVVRMRNEIHCAGFFIARAAMHDPTIFTRMRAALDGHDAPAEPDFATRLGSLLEYLERGKRIGLQLAIARRQAMRFAAGAPGAKRLRAALHDVQNMAALRELVEVTRSSAAAR
jgi:nifR3 family TIM-barrel protein